MESILASTFSCASRSAIPERSALSIHDLGRVVGNKVLETIPQAISRIAWNR